MLSSLKLYTFIALFAFTLARKKCKHTDPITPPKTSLPNCRPECSHDQECVQVDRIELDTVITSYTCVPKNSAMTPKTPPRNPYLTGPKVCLEKFVSCEDQKCDPGYECAVMSSDTHCDTPICVRKDLPKVEDNCPKGCPRGEECGKVESRHDVQWISSMCVSQDENKLPAATHIPSEVCTMVERTCKHKKCDPGHECRIMTSEGYSCGTVMCVPKKNIEQNTCKNCLLGQECAKIRTDNKNSLNHERICIPKNHDAFNRQFRSWPN